MSEILFTVGWEPHREVEKRLKLIRIGRIIYGVLIGHRGRAICIIGLNQVFVYRRAATPRTKAFVLLRATYLYR